VRFENARPKFGVSYSIKIGVPKQWSNYKIVTRRAQNAEGVWSEAPKGVGYGEGVSPSPLEMGLGRGPYPLP